MAPFKAYCPRESEGLHEPLLCIKTCLFWGDVCALQEKLLSNNVESSTKPRIYGAYYSCTVLKNWNNDTVLAIVQCNNDYKWTPQHSRSSRKNVFQSILLIVLLRYASRWSKIRRLGGTQRPVRLYFCWMVNLDNKSYFRHFCHTGKN